MTPLPPGRAEPPALQTLRWVRRPVAFPFSGGSRRCLGAGGACRAPQRDASPRHETRVIVEARRPASWRRRERAVVS
jgi:hypothetical protein